MEIAEFLAIGVIAFISVFAAIILSLKVVIDQLKNSQLFEDLIDNTLQMLSNDEESQKKLYMIGGILGNGVKGGIGLPANKGRTSLKGIAIDLIGQFLQNKVGEVIANPSPSPAPQLPPVQETVKKLTEKW